jgi:hypothetical protein
MNVVQLFDVAEDGLDVLGLAACGLLFVLQQWPIIRLHPTTNNQQNPIQFNQSLMGLMLSITKMK